MSFLVPCPNCGPRDVNEFVTQGEVTVRPGPDATRLHIGKDAVVLVTGLRNPYKQLDKFQPGLMSAMLGREWWYHRLGCQSWFTAERDTRTNEFLGTQ